MMKSSIVGFSAVFSFLFLSRRFLPKEWVAITAILLGTFTITAGTTYFIMQQQTNTVIPNNNSNQMMIKILLEQQQQASTVIPINTSTTTCFFLFGIICLVIAQLLVAGQFILEEYLMDRHHLDPVRAMGIEGIFGTVLLGSSLLISALFGQDEFDVMQGIQDMVRHALLWQSGIALALMVAMFNFFGLAVSTTMGVPGRSMIDTLRTLLTWAIAIHYGWDTFSWIELIGFMILVLGVFLFNGVFSSLISCLFHLIC
ncbi:hypothetical protein BDF20DRAFT_843766 [Mycotypha africana]|uniref:uncharacterized protein n=1 Tax=Mycotypha africana TaxID=64632 RepID=UPI002300DFBE|nr:uncharacterized protein BDF20DRAFT_843766 [Mycotypha africana]KAI8991274.1 hypothetical protein BDF20DRAFT_843766 [Mycotypha africana]